MHSVPVTAFLLLGTNLGDRESYLRRARTELEIRAGHILAVSSVYETEPWGTEGQPSYLNQAVELTTTLSPDNLLASVLDVELSLGRVRERRWGDRTIDIDILYYGSMVVQSAHLEIPHPRLHLRNFALFPLAEIAPDFRHPVLGRSNRSLLVDSEDGASVSKL